ncbi:hypothetical protein EJB05_14718, partial [Eragrostis curvula]
MDRPKKGGMVAGLPDDPLVEIFSHVPIKSLCRSKCVSNAWRDLIADPIHRKKLPQTLEGIFYAQNLFYAQNQHEGIEGDGVGGGDGDGVDGSNGSSGDGENVSGQLAGGKVVYSNRRGTGRFIDLSGRSVPLVDPSFSFLTEVPGIEDIRLLHGCNGLLLFRYGRNPHSSRSLGYIVCNPATKEWVAVPNSGWNSDSEIEDEDEDEEEYAMEECELHYLIYDPSVSSHFKLIQFLQVISSVDNWVGVLTYSSETGKDGKLVVALDGDGKTRREICLPENSDFRRSVPAFVGQSQGRLHCISESYNPEGHPDHNFSQITIWVLEDYNSDEWSVKNSVSSLQLFGRISLDQYKYNVVAIHPDRNLVFFVQHWDRKLISYNMDSKEVRDVCTLEDGSESIAPYVPRFSDSPVLTNKQQ